MSDKADSKARESLSAMVDNEASEFEFFRTVKLLSEDDELRRMWHRYHLASSVMGREGPVTATDLSAQIASAIELEAELSVSTVQDEGVLGARYGRVNSSLNRTFAKNRTFSKIALAASVAMVAVFGVQYLKLGPENSANAPGNQVVSQATSEMDAGLGKPDSIGSQFQLPSGYALPQVNVRTVSTAPVDSVHRSLEGWQSSQRLDQIRGFLGSASPDAGNMTQEQVDRETHRQVENYLNSMKLRHAQE